MKAIAALVVALAACSLPTPPAPQAPAQQQQDVGVVTALQHTLFAEDLKCTAVDIGGGRVVTAKHCVEDDNPERVVDLGEKTSVGVLVFKHEKLDFAILIDQTRVGHNAPTLRQPRLGEHVYAVGYPLQLATEKQALTVTDGVVAGPDDGEGNLRFTAPIFYGNSGGGVWANDGALVGISVQGFLQGYEGMYFMVPAEAVAEALSTTK